MPARGRGSRSCQDDAHAARVASRRFAEQGRQHCAGGVSATLPPQQTPRNKQRQ